MKSNLTIKVEFMKNLKRATFGLSFLIALLASGCSEKTTPQAHTTKNLRQLDESRYVQIFTDPETNCQYITTKDGGITPRLAVNGTHLGC